MWIFRIVLSSERVSIVTFSETIPFWDQLVTLTKVEEDEWLVYRVVIAPIEQQDNVLAEQATKCLNLHQDHPFFVNIPGKKSITMYHMCQLCCLILIQMIQAHSQSDQCLHINDDNLPISLGKGIRQCTLPSQSCLSYCQLYLL